MDFTKTLNKLSCNRVGNSKVGNGSHTKEKAKTKEEYYKILKFYQVQGYKTKAGDYNPNGSIKLYHGDDSVEIVLVGNSKIGNYETGTSKFKPGDKVKVYGVHGVVVRIEGENTNNIYGEPLVVVKSDENGKTQAIPEHYVIKVGNSKVNNTLREYRNRSRDLMATASFNSNGTDVDVEVMEFDFSTGEEKRTIEEKHFDTIQEAEAYIGGKYGLRK